MQFPIDLSGYTPLKFDLSQNEISDEQLVDAVSANYTELVTSWRESRA